MTEARTMRRGRRPTAEVRIPPALARWFAGDDPRPPWAALAAPFDLLLFERWRAWAAEHPGAKPPPGFERIAGPPPKTIHGMPWRKAVADAKRAIRRAALPSEFF